MKHILYCQTCEKYTLKDECCSAKTIPPKPPKFSLVDKYASYRREAKKADLVKRGLA